MYTLLPNPFLLLSLLKVLQTVGGFHSTKGRENFYQNCFSRCAWVVSHFPQWVFSSVFLTSHNNSSGSIFDNINMSAEGKEQEHTNSQKRWLKDWSIWNL